MSLLKTWNYCSTVVDREILQSYFLKDSFVTVPVQPQENDSAISSLDKIRQRILKNFDDIFFQASNTAFSLSFGIKVLSWAQQLFFHAIVFFL